MGGVLAWLRLDLRRRWRSLTVLLLLIALSGALVLAVTAGARRTDSSLQRLLDQSLPASVVVLPNTPGFDWQKVRALPEVTGLASFCLTCTYTVDGISSTDLAFANASPDAYVTVERGVVLAGRTIDNHSVQDAIVNQPFADKYHLRVGDTVTARLYDAKQVKVINDGGSVDPAESAGPTQPLRIVSIVRVPWTFLFGGIDDPGIIPSYAFYQKYKSDLVGNGPDIVNSIVQLRNGEADVHTFEADLIRVTGRHDIDVADLADGAKHVTNATSFEADSLLLFALVVALAAILIVGQAIIRYVAAAFLDLEVLRALGMTRRQAVAAAAAGPVVASAVAALIAVAVAFLASPSFPIGVGRAVEPAPGHNANWLVFLVGGLVMVAVTAMVSLSAALSTASKQDNQRAPRRSWVAGLAARLGMPVPVMLGTRLALEPGRGKTAVPVRPALVGAVAGVVGVVAATTFATGLNEAVNTPERYGVTYQLSAFVGWNGKDFVPPSTISDLEAEPGIAAVNDSVVQLTSSDRSITSFEYEPNSGIEVVSLSGGAPTSDNEIALAPLTAKQLGVETGDQIQVAGEKQQEMTVSGVSFVPSGPHNNYDEGAWLTSGALANLTPSGFFKFHVTLMRLDAGASVAAVTDQLRQQYPGVEFDLPTAPADVVNLRAVHSLPVLLGLFLALLAIGAVGHALATAMRRRRVDIAVLRALGMTRPQVRLTVAWQATTLAIVGLVFGIPLGLALGRTIWRVVAERTPLEYVPPIAIVVMVLVVPLTILLANILAAYPGHRAVSLRVGQILRAE